MTGKSNTVSQGGGTVNLSKVKSYIGDFLDTQNIVVTKGVIDKYNRTLVS